MKRRNECFADILNIKKSWPEAHPFVLDIGAVNVGEQIWREQNKPNVTWQYLRCLPFDEVWWEYEDQFTAPHTKRCFLAQHVKLIDGQRNGNFITVDIEEWCWLPDHYLPDATAPGEKFKGGVLVSTRITAYKDSDDIKFESETRHSPQVVRSFKFGAVMDYPDEQERLRVLREDAAKRLISFLCAINASSVCDTTIKGIRVVPGKPFDFIAENKGPIYCRINKLGQRFLRDTSPNYFGDFTYAQHWVKAHVQPVPINRDRKWTGRMSLHIVGPYLRGAEHLAPATIRQRRVKAD